ncbi:MAG: hypothetical protein ACE1ZT_01635 [Dehalococcoidia bacterium]
MAEGGLADGVTNVVGGGEGEAGLELEGAPALGGEALAAADLRVVGGWQQVEGEAAGGGEGAEGGEALDDLVVFEGVEGFGGGPGSSLARRRGVDSG